MATALDFAALLREERALFRGQKGPAAPSAAPPRPQAVEEEEEDDDDDEVGALDFFGDETRPEPKPVPAPLDTILYVADFITEAEEAKLLAAASLGRWHDCTGRRVRRVGGAAGTPSFVPLPELRPLWARELCAAVQAWVPDANHVLVNRYAPDGYILPHADGPAYAPATATLSCGADAVVVFAPKLAPAEVGLRPADPVCSIVVERRSLLVFRDAAYADYMHAVDLRHTRRAGDRIQRDADRFSFTIRHARPMAPQAADARRE